MTAVPQNIEEFAEDVIFRIRTDPVWFAEKICNLKLDIWQEETLEAMADVIRHWYNEKPAFRDNPLPIKYNKENLDKFTIRAMHGPGKTFLAALCIIWFFTAFQPDRPSPATAPTLKQLKERLWPCLRVIRGGMNEFFQSMIEIRSTSIVWMKNDNWKVVAETGTAVENVQGYHANFMFILCDEASGIDEAMFPVIESATSESVIPIILLIGNPTKTNGTFADSHLKENVSKYYYKIHVDLSKTTRVKREWVQQMVEKYGKDSPVVRIRCYGEFAAEDENQLFALQWLADARAKRYREDGSFPKQRISVDCADGGLNFSCITHARHYQSFSYMTRQDLHSFPGGQAAEMLASEVEKVWNSRRMNRAHGDDIVVDSLGVGAGVCSILVKRGYPVVRYIGGAASDNRALYRCRRVQSFLVCRDRHRMGEVVYAENFVDEGDWDDFDGQMCSIRRQPNTDRIEDLLTKKQMVEAGIKSPDRADSVAMQFATQAPIVNASMPGIVMVGTTALNEGGYDGSLTV